MFGMSITSSGAENLIGVRVCLSVRWLESVFVCLYVRECLVYLWLRLRERVCVCVCRSVEGFIVGCLSVCQVIQVVFFCLS